MVDNRLFLRVKGHPETEIMIAKELSGWYCPEDLTKRLGDWLERVLVLEARDWWIKDLEIIDENDPTYEAPNIDVKNKWEGRTR